MRKNKLKPLLVVWDDAFQISGWQGGKNSLRKRSDAGCIVFSIGFPVKKTKRHLFLAQSVDVNAKNSFSDIMVVPHGMIRKIKQLR